MRQACERDDDRREGGRERERERVVRVFFFLYMKLNGQHEQRKQQARGSGHPVRQWNRIPRARKSWLRP